MRFVKWRMTRTAACVSLGAGVLLLGAGQAPAGGGFVAGSADATARLGRVVARAAGLPLVTTWGGTLAHYQGETARAEVATLDLGALGVMLTSPMACGRALLTPDQLPERTIADSHAGPPSHSREGAGAGDGAGLGREEASAQPRARGTATFTAAALALEELVATDEGRASSQVELVEGRERRATAEVRFGHVAIAGGLVELRGVRWHAEQRTGPDGGVLAAGGSFGVEGVVVAGVPLTAASPSQLATALVTANEALGPFGLRLEAPRVTQASSGREVRVGPLELVIGDATAGRPVVGPVMAELVPVRETLLDALRDSGGGECDLGTAGGAALTFVDVVAGALSGAGGIDLELGGVLATTEGIDYGDPLGLVAPGLPTLAPAPPPAASLRPVVEAPPPAPAPLPPPATELPGPAPGGEPVAAAPPEPAPPTGAAVPATRRCESASGGRSPTCSRGAPLAASAAAFAAGLLLFGADYRRSRR